MMVEFNLKPVIKNVISKENEIIEIIDTMFVNKPPMSMADIQKNTTDENVDDTGLLLELMSLTKDMVKMLEKHL